MARRHFVSKEHVGDRVTALCAGIPGFENGGNVDRSPGDVQRTAVHKHEHNRLTFCHDSFEQLLASAADNGFASECIVAPSLLRVSLTPAAPTITEAVDAAIE